MIVAKDRLNIPNGFFPGRHDNSVNPGIVPGFFFDLLTEKEEFDGF